MCKNVSALNIVGFVLLIVASLLCALSFGAPYWIYYPKRHGVANTDDIRDKYPFRQAATRGLWAVCYKDTDYQIHVSDDYRDVSSCSWFGENNASLWKTIPNWYLAAEGVFVGALVLLLSALIIESLFACCQLCLRRSLIPSTVASLAVAAALMTATSLALFGGFSFSEDEFTPEPYGEDGQLYWAFYVGVVGSVVALVAGVLLYVDGCRLARTYSHYQPPTVAAVS